MKRLIGFLLAVIVAVLLMDGIANPCATLDPSGWLYWALGCPIIAGGGGSGAS